MSNQNFFQNIIAVSNRSLSKRPFLEQITEICHHNPKALILREKNLSETDYTVLAQKVLPICQKNGVHCILHTYFQVAQQLGCTSIHVPFSLLQNHQKELSAFLQIGTSVHSIEEATQAQKLGATYLIAGHIYQTDCKKNIPPRGLLFLKNVCQSVSIPVFAIGGIHVHQQQLQEVMIHGAKGACIMSDIMKL